MPDLTLNHFRGVDPNRQVAISPDKQTELNTEGERHVFLGRLVDKMSRTSEQRENFRTATKSFIDLVKQEYGDKIGNWATRELSEHVEKGKPLTGYRIEKILAKAEEMTQRVEGTVGEVVAELKEKGVELNQTQQRHLLNVAWATVDSFQETGEGRSRESLMRDVEKVVKDSVRLQAELLSPALELGKQTSANWAKNGQIGALALSESSVERKFYVNLDTQITKFGEELEGRGIKRDSTEYKEAVKERLSVLVGRAYNEQVPPSTKKPDKGEGQLMEREIGKLRDVVGGLQKLSGETQARLLDCLNRFEGLRDEVVGLGPDQQGDLGLLLDYTGKFAQLKKEFLDLRPTYQQDKEAFKEWDSALRQHLDRGAAVEDMFTPIKNTLFTRLNLPELNDSAFEARNLPERHLETLGLWRMELQNPDSTLLTDPVKLEEVLKTLTEIEKDVNRVLEETPTHRTMLPQIMHDLAESVKYTREMIQSRQKSVD